MTTNNYDAQIKEDYDIFEDSYLTNVSQIEEYFTDNFRDFFDEYTYQDEAIILAKIDKKYVEVIIKAECRKILGDCCGFYQIDDITSITWEYVSLGLKERKWYNYECELTEDQQVNLEKYLTNHKIDFIQHS